MAKQAIAANAKGYGWTWLTVPAEMPVLVNATRAVGMASHSSRGVRHSNPYWVLDYSLSDLGLFKVGRRTAPWLRHAAGEALLYPPHTPYWEDMSSVKPPIRNAWLMFCGGPGAGLDTLVRSAAGYARFVDPEGRLGRLIEQAAEVGQLEGDGGFWKAMGLLCEALDLLRHSVPINVDTYRIPATILPETPTLATAVTAYLREHMAQRLSLGIMAGHLHVSVSTLSHRYRAETGESPIATLIRLRIQQARNLLMKGQRLKTIAATLGFSDVYHLSKMFKRVEGRSPRQFVKAINAPPGPQRPAAARAGRVCASAGSPQTTRDRRRIL
ncbi:MAG: AraC family transcriptional regulator [Kiritimatiellae bacterium]|nr:AraC family transcriptional regulator [Kiritimatiellia bacterium]